MPTKTYIPKPERLSPEAIQLLESHIEWCMMNQKVSRSALKNLVGNIRNENIKRR